MLFFQLSDLDVRLHFGAVDKLGNPLLFGTSFIDVIVRGVFPMERGIFPVRFVSVAIISE